MTNTADQVDVEDLLPGINLIEGLKLLDLTVVVSTMIDTTDHIDVQDLLPVF